MIKNILRIIIGLIFIVSGFVKAIDVVGFSFKMEEYFAADVFDIPFLEKQALILAIIMVVLELVLGFFLLMKMRLKMTISLLIALCIFFAFLTFYSAYYNVVTDCGCFGDALKLEPWQSFWKDIILLVSLIILFIFYRNDFNEVEKKNNFKKYLSGFAFMAMVFVISWGITHEPLIDFRDYKIGTDLKAEQVKITTNPSIFKTFYSLKNKKTGEILKVNQDDYISKNYWENPDWEIQSDKTTSEIVKQGYVSEIAKFRIEDEIGNSITDEIINAPNAILIFSYNPDQMKNENLGAVIKKMQSNKNAVIIGVSTKPETFKNIKNALMDGTAIKTIARSNPFVLTLQNGKIIAKSSVEDYIKQN